jgi:hypothetical protein
MPAPLTPVPRRFAIELPRPRGIGVAAAVIAIRTGWIMIPFDLAGMAEMATASGNL